MQTIDLVRAHRLASQLDAGAVWINGFPVMGAAMPFGGYKQSGFGREGGRPGSAEYLQTKTVFLANPSCCHQLRPALLATAVPMHLGLTNPHTFHRLAELRHVVLLAYAAVRRYAFGSRSGRDPLSSAHAVSMKGSYRPVATTLEIGRGPTVLTGSLIRQGHLTAACAATTSRWRCGAVRRPARSRADT
ncbi:aldehyde dehydrogenase family protein [Gordonia oryzae]|uniref:aldehyde dehydrogenase family protein n=1 Tax=Gordonia oryzae TaxID=2487349 RepID=UPI003CCC7AFE